MPLDFSTTTFPFRISNLCPSIVTVRIAVWKNDFHLLYFAVDFSLSLIQWRKHSHFLSFSFPLRTENALSQWEARGDAQQHYSLSGSLTTHTARDLCEVLQTFFTFRDMLLMNLSFKHSLSRWHLVCRSKRV